MAEEVVVRSGKTLQIQDATWVVVDGGVPPVVPTIFTEARTYDGIIYLAFAQSIIDGDNGPEAHICARLRLGLGFAQMLRSQLDRLIKDALEPPDQSKAN